MKSSETATLLPGQGIAQDNPSNAGMIAGTSQVSAMATPQHAAKNPVCPKLDSQLNQVANSSNPMATATDLNLRVEEGMVLVHLTLAGEDASFLKEYGVEVSSQVGKEIQAFMPIDKLCEISNREEILIIRIPSAGIMP